VSAVGTEAAMSPAGGILRGARRPTGWRVPGPVPPSPATLPNLGELWPRPDEDLCWLAGHWRILQRRDGHRFSLDDLVTAEMAARVFEAGVPARDGHRPARPAPRPAPPRFLDLGCGVGTVLLFLAWRFPEARLTGIEAQAVSAGLARRSIAWNGVSDRCTVIEGDLRDAAAVTRFDLITGTPPYFSRGEGTESDRVQRAPCRFEHRGGLGDYCRAAARLMAPGAALVACAAALQFATVEPAARAAGLAVERWREIVPRAGKAPLLATFSLRHATLASPRVDEASLVVRDGGGRWTAEFLRVRDAMGMPPAP
jgi:tRNA1Val (adenine37-N6)-methyltransferase